MSVAMKQGLDWDELKLVFWGGPLAIILVRKNHLKLRKMDRMREFTINEFGIFEVDSETEYRYGKQPISFYNSHGTSIPKKIVKKVKSLYQKGKFFQIREELEQIYPEIKGMHFKNIYELFGHIVKQTNHQAVDIDTEKFLTSYYRAYNPISIKRLNEVCQAGRRAVESLHPNFKPPMPIMIAVIGGILGLAFIQNAPKWIREAGNYMETRLQPAPLEESFEAGLTEPEEEVVEPVTEDELVNGGVDVVNGGVEIINEGGVDIVSPAQFILSLISENLALLGI